jgi:type IV secretory pathway TrbL component
MIKNIIKYAATGVLALALGTSCAAPQKALYSASDNEWQPGVTTTATGYEAIACSNVGLIMADTDRASRDAQQSIADFVNAGISRNEDQAGNGATKISSASMYGVRELDRNVTDNGVCVKLAVPYTGVHR